MFVAVGLLSQGASAWFASATVSTLGWLVFSGFIGIVVGDTASLQSLRLIGARRYIMIDSLRPFISSLYGWAFLGSEITVGLVAGMAITTVGVLMVSLERESASHETDKPVLDATGDMPAADAPLLEPQPEAISAPARSRRLAWMAIGYALAVLHAILDVTGSLVTRQVGGQYSSMEINTVRFGSSAVLLGIIATCSQLYRWLTRKTSAPAERQPAGTQDGSSPTPHWSQMPKMGGKAWSAVAIGSLLGTFVCPYLGVLSLFKISFPVYATLSSLAPVYCLPLAWLMCNQRVTGRAIIGSVLAFLGVIPLYYSA